MLGSRFHRLQDSVATEAATTTTITTAATAAEPFDDTSGILTDTDGSARGICVSLEEDERQLALGFLLKVYESIVGNMGSVQDYTPNLKHYNFPTAGLPKMRGFKGANVAENLLTAKMKEVLKDIGCCNENQTIQVYLSLLKTVKTEVQPPHIDYNWNDVIPPPDSKKRSRSYNGNIQGIGSICGFVSPF